MPIALVAWGGVLALVVGFFENAGQITVGIALIGAWLLVSGLLYVILPTEDRALYRTNRGPRRMRLETALVATLAGAVVIFVLYSWLNPTPQAPGNYPPDCRGVPWGC